MFLAAQGPGAKVSAGRIAQGVSVPERFNLKILRKLTMGGIVESTRGIYGGFILKRDPAELTLLDVVEAVDGPVRLCRCIGDARYCTMEPQPSSCPLRERLEDAGAALRRTLSATTFADLASEGFGGRPT